MEIDVCQESIKYFLSLIRLGIGKHAEAIPKIKEWADVEDLAIRHGLSAVLVDGVEQLTGPYRPPQDILLQWIGETLQGYEYRYDQYRKAVSELAGFYNSHGFKMMVLKGYACSLDWPKPSHRPCGDIDIWLFGKQKEADTALAKEKRIKIDKGHHHHTIFEWNGFTVENHYDFINVSRHASHEGLERWLKELGTDDSYFVEVLGEKVYLPSPNLHALFLLRHALNHFASVGLNMRQVLDWAFFIEKHSKEVDWAWLMSIVNEYHIINFFNCLNAICVEELGFSPTLFPSVQFNPFLKEKVLADILASASTDHGHQNLISRLVYKYMRWKANEWKHELCYKESMWSAFWSGVWNHLLKPSSI